MVCEIGKEVVCEIGKEVVCEIGKEVVWDVNRLKNAGSAWQHDRYTDLLKK